MKNAKKEDTVTSLGRVREGKERERRGGGGEGKVSAGQETNITLDTKIVTKIALHRRTAM